MSNPVPEPVPLGAVIASSIRSASTPAPTRPMACKLAGRGEPIRAIRPAHHRGREGMRPELLALVRALARGERPWPLYLWSREPGTGKTSCALVMLDHYGPLREGCEYSEEVREVMLGFIDFASFPRVLRAGEKGRHWCSTDHHCDTVYDTTIWSNVRGANVLVLDDVRKPGDREQAWGDDYYGALKRVLDVRVGRPLIITSNLDPWEPAGGGVPELVRVFDDRIADRILCGTVFELSGASRRGE